MDKKLIGQTEYHRFLADKVSGWFAVSKSRYAQYPEKNSASKAKYVLGFGESIF